MKISMTSLGNEECDVCERYKQHQNSYTCIDLYDINEFVVHKAKYKPARAVYTKDAEENCKQLCDLKIFVDLQKVIMLPRIDEFKACVFTQRFIVFNGTLSDLGKHGRDTAVL
ncbi:hypothetical protein RRG08_016426 [Elysia crispata]|uniref:Uncharacterized protein n=1 Tax=Elysia crispata TaxID=231223 RepID=A0AAE1CUP2_9GAST|nr:hypothetical protein RRG08_016426 [Elysia crispata]